jgi:hypothetical protein
LFPFQVKQLFDFLPLHRNQHSARIKRGWTMYNHNNTRQSIGILKKAIVSIRPTNENNPTSFVRSFVIR